MTMSRMSIWRMHSNGLVAKYCFHKKQQDRLNITEDNITDLYKNVDKNNKAPSVKMSSAKSISVKNRFQ